MRKTCSVTYSFHSYHGSTLFPNPREILSSSEKLWRKYFIFLPVCDTVHVKLFFIHSNFKELDSTFSTYSYSHIIVHHILPSFNFNLLSHFGPYFIFQFFLYWPCVLPDLLWITLVLYQEKYLSWMNSLSSLTSLKMWQCPSLPICSSVARFHFFFFTLFLPLHTLNINTQLLLFSLNSLHLAYFC